jgi:NAD(P)-dependent dehydrogenase (short-subunit alcohol dehydrogenase family)
LDSGFLFVNAANFGPPRTAVEERAKFLQFFPWADCVHLHASVVQVAYVPGQPKPGSRPLREVAVSDTLHDSPNEPTPRLVPPLHHDSSKPQIFWKQHAPDRRENDDQLSTDRLIGCLSWTAFPLAIPSHPSGGDLMSDIRKIALVTGAGSGIGRAAALALECAGFTVVLAGRRASELARTASQSAGHVLVVPTDVSDPQSVSNLFARIRAEYGRLDLLFNNAGIGAPPIPIEDLSYEQWNRVVAVNLTGSFLCAQHAIRMMKEQIPRGGRIINNGSLSAHVPRPHSAPYTATKHAITGLTRSIALDGRNYGIACSQIDIGNAATPMTEHLEGLEPRMDLEHVARAIVYIATLPVEANVPFMTLMATGMPYMGRG